MFLDVNEIESNLFEECYSNHMNSLLENNSSNKMKTVLLEAYYGKNPILLQIEKHVENIRQEVLKNAYYNPNNTEDHKKICQLFEKLFNFEIFWLTWDTSALMGNAFTMPVGLFIFSDKSFYDVEKGPNGVRFKTKEGKFVIVHAFTGLFTNTKLTSAELVAVILHEIGHNFFNSYQAFIANKIFMVYYLLMLLIIMLKIDAKLAPYLIKPLLEFIVVTTGTGRNVIYQINKFLRDIPGVDAIIKFIIYIISMINDVKLYIQILILQVTSIIPIPLASILTLADPTTYMNLLVSTARDSYRNEKFSDNFATSFGYGPETVSTQSKLEMPRTVIDTHIPLIANISNMTREMGRTLTRIFDPHPAPYTRMTDQISLLKAELNKNNLPSPMRKKIEEDIKRMNEVLKHTESEEFLEEHRRYYSHAFTLFLDRTFNTGKQDIREKVYKTNDYEYGKLMPE